MRKATQSLSTMLAMLTLMCISLVSFTSCSDSDEPAEEVTYSWEFEEVNPSTPDFMDDINKIESTFKAALGASGTATSVTRKGTSETCDKEVLEACNQALESLKGNAWQGHYTFIVTNVTTGNVIFSHTFDADDENDVTYTASDLKMGDYYYSDGNWSDGGLRGDNKWVEPRPQPLKDKTVIGIVFYAGHHPADQSDYTETGIGQAKCHGYAVALKDATSGRCKWGGYRDLGCYPMDADGKKRDNFRNPDIDWCGYDWTQKIINAAGGKDKLNATEKTGYPASWYAVVSYETGCNAPSNSSGWFLPSIGQISNIDRNHSSLFGSVSGAEDLMSDLYWCSSEFYADPAFCLSIYMHRSFVICYDKNYSCSYVRPVLAF